MEKNNEVSRMIYEAIDRAHFRRLRHGGNPTDLREIVATSKDCAETIKKIDALYRPWWKKIFG